MDTNARQTSTLEEWVKRIFPMAIHDVYCSKCWLRGASLSSPRFTIPAAFQSWTRLIRDFHPSARIVNSTLNIIMSMERKFSFWATYVAKVPALTGIALSNVGPMPFQNPLIPSCLHVCRKQSIMLW